MLGLNMYQYKVNKTFMVYTFQSQGPKGIILKIAKFSFLGNNIYNFGFGDFDQLKGENYHAFLGRRKAVFLLP
jgi:hypothetical protein